MFGYSNLEEEMDRKALPISQNLLFYADSFLCENCGLELHDVDELGLAGLSIVYDRNLDIDNWLAEEYYKYH